MNKTFFIVLAVCLACTHAFVKRDVPAAPASGPNYLEDIKHEFDKFGQKVQAAINPETIKKGISDFVDNASKVIDEFRPKTTPKA